MNLCIVPRVVLLGLLPLTTGACGFVFVHAPPAEHERMDFFSCTESNTGPILDAIVAGLSVFGIAYAAGTDDPDIDKGASIAGNVVGVALWGSAAVVGFNKTNRCREAKRALMERLRGMGGYPLMQDPGDSTKARWGTVRSLSDGWSNNPPWARSNVTGTRFANPATDTTTAR